MQLENRIHIIKLLIEVTKMEQATTIEEVKKNNSIGKCIWIDLDGNKRCSNWTESQLQFLPGRFYVS
jgi:hypothetical protein